jgi:hypothetical protein
MSQRYGIDRLIGQHRIEVITPNRRSAPESGYRHRLGVCYAPPTMPELRT